MALITQLSNNIHVHVRTTYKIPAHMGIRMEFNLLIKILLECFN